MALLLLSVVLITVSVRVGNTGAFAVVRSGVQTVSGTLQSVCSIVGKPFSALNKPSSGLTEEEAEALRTENEQLKTLVAQLEEYRQQDQRLTTLMALSDAYGLETVSARVISTTEGWSRTATIDAGSKQGIKVGMGVMSSCGLYGQITSVSANSSTVKLITDAASNVSAMVQSTRESGILTGSYDGNLTLDYISVDSNVGVGDAIITSGEGGTYPRGMIIGTVKSIEPDSSRIYYRIAVEPIYRIASCEEVMVLTGNESETESLVDLDLINSIKNSIGSTYAARQEDTTGNVSEEEIVAEEQSQEQEQEPADETAESTEATDASALSEEGQSEVTDG